MGSAFLLELGELANLTVMGSAAPSGMVPLSCLIARSASLRWSKRMKPTPLDSPVKVGKVRENNRQSQFTRGGWCIIGQHATRTLPLLPYPHTAPSSRGCGVGEGGGGGRRPQEPPWAGFTYPMLVSGGHIPYSKSNHSNGNQALNTHVMSNKSLHYLSKFK